MIGGRRDVAGPLRRTVGVTRHEMLAFAATAAGAALAGGAHAQPSERKPMLARTIPSTGEALPAVGCGTWQTFDVGPDANRRVPLAGVLDTLFSAGGSVVDSSPMYGSSEEVAGDLLAASGSRAKAFIATKVWTRGREAGIRQMKRSFELFHTDRIDLMQVHNLVDWRVHLATLRSWKSDGTVRYVGVTHYTSSAYAELEAVLRSERLDFVQVNYSADDRAAEARILPLAAERGMAVLINMPFGGGGLLRRLRSRPLPDWAGEIGCGSWAQILLKFVLSQPAVTSVIPGTSNAAHMQENAAAGTGPLPDAATRAKIVAAI